MTGARFTLFGFPVRVDGSFVLVALIGLTYGSASIALIWVLAVFVTTLVHELGHAFAFRAYGQAPSITLWGMGGLTSGNGPPLSRGKDVVVSLAGSVTEMILIGFPALYVASRVEPASPTASFALHLVVWIGVGWALVNLIPVLPLDGGRVAANVLEGLWGIKGARAARWLSIVVAAGAAIFAVTQRFIFAAFFAVFFIAQNWNDLQRFRDAPLGDRLTEGHKMIDRGDSAGAVRIAEEVASRTRNEELRAGAIILLAWAHISLGHRADAAVALTSLPSGVRPGRSILAYMLLLDGLREEATKTFVDGILEGLQGAIPPNGQLPLALEREGLLDEVVDRLMHAEGDNGANAVRTVALYLHMYGRYAAAARLWEALFAGALPANRGVSAFNGACALARDGRPDEAMVWLERSVDEGFTDAARLESDDDLASLRGTDGFARVLARARKTPPLENRGGVS